MGCRDCMEPKHREALGVCSEVVCRSGRHSTVEAQQDTGQAPGQAKNRGQDCEKKAWTHGRRGTAVRFFLCGGAGELLLSLSSSPANMLPPRKGQLEGGGLMAAARCFPSRQGHRGPWRSRAGHCGQGALLRSTAVARMPLPHQTKNLRASVRVTLDLSSRSALVSLFICEDLHGVGSM